MCCDDKQNEPDYEAQKEASMYATDKSFEMFRLRSEQEQKQYEQMYAVLDRTLSQQSAIAAENHAAALEDRARYKEVYQGMEDYNVAEAKSFSSPERIAMERGRAEAAVQTAFESQRENAQRQLEAYGIDPSQTRSAAMDRNARIAAAAQQAGASNIAAANTEAIGRALRAEAVNIGKGYPSQVAAAYGTSLNASNSAMGNVNTTASTAANAFGNAQSWMNSGLNANAQTVNTMNMGFQNQMQAAQFNREGGVMAGLGQLAGIAGGLASTYMEEGGHVPSDMSAIPGPNDQYPVMLAEDEYVIPAEVVRFKGVEFFDRLVEKSRKGAIPQQG